MSEFHRLRAYLECRGTFTEEEFAFLERLFLPQTLRAGEFRRAIEKIPAYAAGFRDGLQRESAAKEQRIANALSESAEERYEAFLKKYPSIAGRVPQFMLASYLGVSPETLSRIRKHRSREVTREGRTPRP